MKKSLTSGDIIGNSVFSLWDYTLWPILKLIWEPYSKKKSHFWHWIKYNDTKNIVCSVVVQRDKNAKNRRSWWANFYQTNFGWKRIQYLRLSDRPHSWSSVQYQIGFYNQDKEQYEICSLILRGEVAVLCGDKDVKFFAIDYLNGRSLTLYSDQYEEHKSQHNPKRCSLI